MFKLRPLKGQYVVSRVPETETQRNGLFIPEQAQEKPLEGIVEAVPQIPIVQIVDLWKRSDGLADSLPDEDRAKTAKFEATQVQVGDRVLFGKYSGTEIKFAGTSYLILKEEDILAVVIPEPSPELGNSLGA